MAKAPWGVGLVALGVGLLVLTRRNEWSRIEPRVMQTQWRWDRLVKRKPSSSVPMRIFVVVFGCVSILLGLASFISLISS